MKSKNLSQLNLFVFAGIIIVLMIAASGGTGLANRNLDSVNLGDPSPTHTGTSTSTPTITSTATNHFTHTPTLTGSPSSTTTATPSCDLLVAENPLSITSGDDVVLQIFNNNLGTAELIASTLIWNDYYDPDQFVDWFRFGVQYYGGDDFDSPSAHNPLTPVPMGGISRVQWRTDFDGIGQVYGQARIVGPFTLDLVFEVSGEICPISETIPEVYVEITYPEQDDVITASSQSGFEAVAWDTGQGNSNGDGIDRVSLILIDPEGAVIQAVDEASVPYCMWGSSGSSCDPMDPAIWDTLIEGTYTLSAWSRSAETSAWAPEDLVTFELLTGNNGATPTPTPTGTLTPHPPSFWSWLPSVLR